MAEIENKPNAAATAPDVKPAEVSLEEIDRLLEADDPEFTKSLDQIKEVGNEADVNIESAVAGEETLSTEDEDEKKKTWFDKFPLLAKIFSPAKKLKDLSYTRWLRIKMRVVILFRQIIIIARTLPTELAGYVKTMIAIITKTVKSSIKFVRSLSMLQLVAWIGFIGLCGVTLILLKKNVGGVWLTGWGNNTITDITKFSDQSWTVAKDEQLVQLFRAFPQEEIEFLFPKVIVNLKSDSAYRNPMGAFEFYVVLDSKDVALEVKARRDELHDRLQRALESQTYGELTSPLGKKRVKDLLRRELNDVLSQGWVKDVLIKTMIVKP